MKCKPRKPTEILRARDKIIEVLKTKKLDSHQLALFQGMSVALQWVSQDGGSTLQDLLDGREVVERGL